jgi:hypothetical protein
VGEEVEGDLEIGGGEMKRRCSLCGKKIKIEPGKFQTEYKKHVAKCTGLDIKVKVPKGVR